MKPEDCVDRMVVCGTVSHSIPSLIKLAAVPLLCIESQPDGLDKSSVQLST